MHRARIADGSIPQHRSDAPPAPPTGARQISHSRGARSTRTAAAGLRTSGHGWLAPSAYFERTSRNSMAGIPVFSRRSFPVTAAGQFRIEPWKAAPDSLLSPPTTIGWGEHRWRIQDMARGCPRQAWSNGLRLVEKPSPPALPMPRKVPTLCSANSLVGFALTMATPIAELVVIGLAIAAAVCRTSWGWVIGAILGIAASFGSQQIVAWIRSMFGVSGGVAEKRNAGVTADPLFVGITRPPMRLAVTYTALLLNAAFTMEVSLRLPPSGSRGSLACSEK